MIVHVAHADAVAESECCIQGEALDIRANTQFLATVLTVLKCLFFDWRAERAERAGIKETLYCQSEVQTY
jgi:hypothetical protein